MRNFILQIITGILGLWLATKFVSGVEFTGPIQILVFCGLVLGLLNFFVKPLLKIITLPLRILTFGLFGLVINLGIIWLLDVIFPQLIIEGFLPLFWTTIIIWGVSLILGLFSK